MKISMTYTMQQKQTNEKPDSLLIIEKWKKVSSRSANDEVDCGDKKCYLEFQILQDCNLILETNATNCKIPCLMVDCDTELHHFISCPVWNCEPTISTTTASTSTMTTTTDSGTSTTTSKPKPNPFVPKDMTPLIYTSIVLNIFFFAILASYIIGKCRARANQISLRLLAQQLDPNRFFSNAGNSAGNSENESDNETDPLIPAAVAVQENQSSAVLTIEQQNLLPLAVSTLSSITNQNSTEALAIAVLPVVPDWNDISLASSESEVPGATATCLNEICPEQKSIFVRMGMKALKKK